MASRVETISQSDSLVVSKSCFIGRQRKKARDWRSFNNDHYTRFGPRAFAKHLDDNGNLNFRDC
jgi:hypothetical protein